MKIVLGPPRPGPSEEYRQDHQTVAKLDELRGYEARVPEGSDAEEAPERETLLKASSSEPEHVRAR